VGLAGLRRPERNVDPIPGGQAPGSLQVLGCCLDAARRLPLVYLDSEAKCTTPSAASIFADPGPSRGIGLVSYLQAASSAWPFACQGI
jgi:hypothetical protein